MSNLPFDIKKTKAVLIGVSNYEKLSPIQPALRNVDAFHAILTNPEIIGLAESNICKILDKTHSEICKNIMEFFKNDNFRDTETLIFYYVGHGIRESKSKEKELYLTGTNTESDLFQISAIPYSVIKGIIEEHQIQTRILIIDACYSGLLAQDTKGENYTEEEMDINGTYVLASSASNEKSFFDDKYPNTFFTKELISVLEKGLPNNKEFISLEDIYASVRKNLKHSLPQRKSNLNVADFFICRNTQYNEYIQLEKEADELYATGKYEEAKRLYCEIQVDKPNEKLKQKIEKCKEYINVIKLTEKRKKEEEQTAKEQTELKHKQEEERITREQTELKGKQKKELKAKKQVRSKSKQNQEKIDEGKLAEKNIYEAALEMNSIRAYENFLLIFPESVYSDDVRNRIKKIELNHIKQKKLEEEAEEVEIIYEKEKLTKEAEDSKAVTKDESKDTFCEKCRSPIKEIVLTNKGFKASFLSVFIGLALGVVIGISANGNFGEFIAYIILSEVFVWTFFSIIITVLFRKIFYIPVICSNCGHKNYKGINRKR